MPASDTFTLHIRIFSENPPRRFRLFENLTDYTATHESIDYHTKLANTSFEEIFDLKPILTQPDFDWKYRTDRFPRIHY